MTLSAPARASLTRVILDLRGRDGMPVRRIAARLALSPRTVERLSRAGGWAPAIVPGVVTRITAHGSGLVRTRIPVPEGWPRVVTRVWGDGTAAIWRG